MGRKMSGKVVVEPYNAVLSLHYMLENATTTHIMDNGALWNINHNVLKNRTTEFKVLNKLIQGAMLDVTAPFRFESTLESQITDLVRQNTSLVAFPRLKFLTLGRA